MQSYRYMRVYRSMSSLPLVLSFLVATIAADINCKAVASTELPAAKVSFQRFSPNKSPTQNVASVVSSLISAVQFSRKYANSAKELQNLQFVRNYSGRKKRSSVKGRRECIKDVDTLLASGGEIAADEAEDVRANQSPKATGDFLLKFHHA